MKKKTTGTDDLIKTLIKQHGLEGAIRGARIQLMTVRGVERQYLWRDVYTRLKDMR